MTIRFLSLTLTTLITCTCFAEDAPTTPQAQASSNKSTDARFFSRLDATELTINLIPKELNQDVENDQAEDLVSDDAFYAELAFLFESERREFSGFCKSTHAYFALHYVQFRDASDDEDWADNTTSLGIVYGHKYYQHEDFSGFGYGWYAGLAYITTDDSHFWNTTNGSAFTEDDEDEINPVVAGEAFYKFQYNKLIIQPRLLLIIDEDDETLFLAPQIMLGMQF